MLVRLSEGFELVKHLGIVFVKCLVPNLCFLEQILVNLNILLIFCVFVWIF